MREERLEGLMLLEKHNDANLDVEDVLENFAAKPNRRLILVWYKNTRLHIYTLIYIIIFVYAPVTDNAVYIIFLMYTATHKPVANVKRVQLKMNGIVYVLLRISSFVLIKVFQLHMFSMK